MRKHSRRRNIFLNNSLINPSAQRESSIQVTDTTTPPSTDLFRWRTREQIKTFSLEIASHVTIFGKVELSRKRISLLLEQEIVRCSLEGFSLLDFFSFEWMVNYLEGSKSLHEITGKRLSTVVYCAILILESYKDTENLLYRKSPILSNLKELIGEIFGEFSDRKYQGRRSIYTLEKFLSFKIEDVEVFFLSRSQNTIPYSSYCKGYGEGGRSVRKQRTRFSYELDRDDSEPIQEEFNSLEEIHHQEDLFYLEQIIRMNKKKT